MMTVRSDNPIKEAADDKLGRSHSATSFATQIQEIDASEGAVVGVLGAWGSGKTSFVNLVRNELSAKNIPMLDFNPWMFSGANQLVDAFFSEISAQLKLKDGKFKDIGEAIEKYSGVLAGLGWLPVVGTWVERIRLLGKGINKVRRGSGESVITVRDEVVDALEKLEQPIVIVIDDIDRLNSSEIRDIFKLVRLTASFPNTIYVLAFDRLRVEKALSEQGVPGRDYLEKILQLAIDLPATPPEVLNKQIFAAIEDSLKDLENTGPFNQEAWSDIYYEVIRPLINNMRDVRRYALAIRGAVISSDGKVALQDILALEAVRIFLPDVYSEIRKSVAGLTELSSGYGYARDDPPYLKQSVEKIIEVAGENKELANDLIKRVFPAAERHIGNMHYGIDSRRQWLRSRRVAHESIFNFYLERQENKQLSAFSDAEKAFHLLADKEKFKKHLQSLEPERLEDVISSLENFENDYPEDSVVPAITVLLNIADTLPEKSSRDMFDFDSRMVVGRVVYRFLKRLPNAEATENAVDAILPHLNSFSAKYELVTDVGYREGAGHKLVTEEVAERLEANLKSEIRAASATKLSKEKELLRLLLFVNQDLAKGESIFIPPSNYKLTHAILLSSRSEVRSNTMGSRAIKTSHRLAWDILADLFGSEENLKAKIERARNRYPEHQELYELFDKYASGWRPGSDD